MMLRWRVFCGGCRGNLILAVALLLLSNFSVAADLASASEGAKYKLITLKNISNQHAKQHLAAVTKVTVTHYPNTATILVSGEQPEVARAETVLDLIDSPEQYVIQTISSVSAARNMPSNDQIAAKLHPSLTRGISIGSFAHPPRKDVSDRAIIDIYDGSVVAIAPAKLLERIVSVINPVASRDGLDEHEEPTAQAKQQTLSNRHVSALVEPSEAKFIFAADDPVKAPPKSSPPKTKLDPDVAKAEPKPSMTEARLNSLVARATRNTSAARPQSDVIAAGPEEEITVLGAGAESIALESAPNPDEIVNLALADFEKLTIVQFLGLVGPYLQFDFLYDPKLLTAEFAINPNGKWRGPIKVGDLYPMLEDVLRFNKLAMTRSGGNLVTIVPVSEAIEIDPPLVDSGLATIDRGNGIVTRVFDLKHVDTTSATNLLTSMRLTIVPPIPKGKALIVTGYAHRMPRIETLLNIIDEPGEVKKFRFRQLRYTMAETLAPKLQILAEQLGTISITVSQTSQSTTTTPTTTTRRAGETTAQYEARRRAEAAARARALAVSRSGTSTTTPQAAPETSTVFLDSDERTNRILMIGLDEQLDEVEKLIDTLDVAQQDLRTLEIYKIEHIDAEEVRNKLEELGVVRPRLTTSSYSSRITGAKPSTTTSGTTRTPMSAKMPTSDGTEMYDGEQEAPGEEPQIVVIEQTNSLLVNATTEQHEKVARILRYIDSEMLDSDIPVQLYPLENQSPAHLAEILEKLIQETFEDKEGKIEKVARRPDEEMPIIVPEPNTFSLIVYASKKNQEWIGNIIKNLDKRRPQVLIDVTLVQISKSDAFDYDLNILSSFPDLTDTSGMTSAIMGAAAGAVSGATGGGGSENLVSTLTGSSRDRFIDFQSKGGLGRGFYGDRHINALLTAMQQKDYGRVLAKPKILVNDNEPGMISSTDVTYVTTQGSTIVPGQTGGSVQTSIDYQPYDAGITLNITPHISSGDLLRLDILLTRSDFGTITGEKPPDTQNSDIETTVTIPDGSTIILGGLIKLNQSKGGTKVPILGDLPLVGGLFRSASNSDIQRSLYIFVKAEIIRPAESGLAQVDLERISDRNRTAFEEHEGEFQQYHDWPGIKPDPMKPLKVLDAQ